MNHTAGRIVFELALDGHRFAGLQRHRSRDVDIGLDPQHQIALLVEFEQEAFVFTASPRARTENEEHGTFADDLGSACTTRIERADVRVVRLLCNAAATPGARKEREGEG
jgi:hypothetical protein